MRAPTKLNLLALLTLIISLAGTLPAESKTFRWSYSGDIATMDPQALRETFSREFVHNIMEPLVSYDKEMKIEPALAERWELKSPEVWRFYLRKGVTFHNGDKFSADDVLFTFNRGRQKTSPFRGNVNQIVDIKKIDDFTIDIVTKGPHPLLLRDLPAMLIFNSKWVKANNAEAAVDPSRNEESFLTRNAMGTGPFMLKEYTPDTRTVLAANPNWWNNAKKEHNLTNVIFTPIGSDATRVAALLSGELDLIIPAPLQDLSRIDRHEGSKVLEAPALRAVFLAMDVKSDQLRVSNVKGANPLKDIRVRKALYQAIDVKTIVKRVMRGHAEVSSVIMSPFINGYDKRLDGRLLPYDPAASKKLMAEAGYPNGFEVGLDCPNDRYINDEEICVAVTAMWAKIGVKAKLTAQTKSNHFKKMLGGNSDIFMFGWASATTLDAFSFLKDIFHTPDGSYGNWNPGGYSNPKIDKLTNVIAVETDETKRNALLHEAFEINKKDISHIPLHTQTVVWAARQNVSAVMTPINILFLKWVKMN
ncbi:MAG: ABC transporter substrate-binding protein [Alphaproteobacteria bacterium]|nr:ABC transporter substrate-binding protein [Alphaproteobacteria bacterium]